MNGDCDCRCGHLYHAECYPQTAEHGGCYDDQNEEEGSTS